MNNSKAHDADFGLGCTNERINPVLIPVVLAGNFLSDSMLMKDLPTLILPPRYTADSIALWRAAIQVGWDVERLQSWRVPAWLRDRDPVVYGEPIFGDAIAQALSLVLLEPSPGWLTELPTIYLQRQIRYATLGDARAYNKTAFIKPVRDKCFLAKVYGSGVELPTSDILPDSTPVLISEPVLWEVEFRCFVRDRTIAASSPYCRYGSLAQSDDGSWPASRQESEEAREFCNTVLGDRSINLPAAVVIDVGKIVDKGWAVVEANSAWASGIYGCDPTLVLPVIQRACLQRDRLAS